MSRKRSFKLLIPAMPADLNDFARVALRTSILFMIEFKSIEDHMQDLRRLSREVPGWNYYLDIQRRMDRCSSALRWRNCEGSIVADSVVLASINSYPVAMQEWYRAIHGKVLWLNASERVCRRLNGEFKDLAYAIASSVGGD